jgi:4-diphosphocytidyl-2-C-methyl-D-erythritol kinase
MVDQSFRAECILPRGQTWIAKPSFGVSTPQAYQACQPQELPQRNPLAVLEGFLKGQPEFFNDLEHSVFRLAPDLSAIKRKLQEMNFSSVVMTGSGSAFICVGSASPKPIEDVQFFSIQPQQRQPAGWYSSPL